MLRVQVASTGLSSHGRSAWHGLDALARRHQHEAAPGHPARLCPPSCARRPGHFRSSLSASYSSFSCLSKHYSRITTASNSTRVRVCRSMCPFSGLRVAGFPAGLGFKLIAEKAGNCEKKCHCKILHACAALQFYEDRDVRWTLSPDERSISEH